MLKPKVMVSARIPKELSTFCLQHYENMSIAINTALELLRDQESIQNENNCIQNENICKQDQEGELNGLQEQIISNDENYKEIINGYKVRIEERDQYIETLKRELEKAHQDKDNIQNIYDNYMRQMQTLIQQKAIEVPGDKKKPWYKFW